MEDRPLMVYSESLQIVRGSSGCGSVSRIRAIACEGRESVQSFYDKCSRESWTCIHLGAVVRLQLARQPLGQVPAEEQRDELGERRTQAEQRTLRPHRDPRRRQSRPSHPPCRFLASCHRNRLFAWRRNRQRRSVQPCWPENPRRQQSLASGAWRETLLRHLPRQPACSAALLMCQRSAVLPRWLAGRRLARTPLPPPSSGTSCAAQPENP